LCQPRAGRWRKWWRMKALVVKARLFWGYSARVPGQSGAKMALHVLSPSMLVGALANFCAYGVEYGAVERVARDVEWAAMGVLDLDSEKVLEIVAVADIEKALNVPYMENKRNRENRALWFSVQPIGKVYLPSLRIAVAYFGDVAKYERCAWGIARMGSKESLVAVEDVAIYDVEPVGRANFTTPLYVRSDRATCSPKALRVKVPVGKWEPRYTAPPSYVEVCVSYDEYRSERAVKFGEWFYAL